MDLFILSAVTEQISLFFLVVYDNQ